MSKSTSDSNIQFLTGGGEMGGLTRNYDWSQTSLGSPDTWPQSLRTTLSIILNSKFPMFLFWGQELTCFYNDAYRPSLGNEGKHPRALGMPAKNVWPEIWADIKPLIDQVLAGGEATWSEDQLLPIYRNGKLEDVYWTFSYSPVSDESGQPAGVFVTCVETTDKVVNLQMLHESKKQLEFAIEAAELGTFDYNPVTNKFFGNQRLINWFGLQPSDEIDLGDAINAIADKDKERVINAIQSSFDITTGGNYDVVYTITNATTNSERIVNAKGKAYFNENGVAYRFNGTLQDITPQVLARRKLEESERRLRLVILKAPVSIAIFRGENFVTEIVNDRALELWGRKENEVVGRPILEAMPELVAQGIGKLLDGVYKDGIAFSASELPVQILRNGKLETIYTSFVYDPVYDVNGDIDGIMTVGVEMTDQVNARRKIEESEERFRTMAEGSNIMIAVSDETSNATYFNKAWERLTGRSMDNLIDFGWADLIHHEDRDIFVSNYLNCFEQQIPWTGEFRLIDKNDDYRWLLADGAVRYNPDGTFAGYISSSMDITEQVEARKKIQESEQQVRNIVESAPFPIGVYAGKEMHIVMANQSLMDIWGKGNDIIGKRYAEVLPELEGQGIYEQLDHVLTTGIPINVDNQYLELIVNGEAKPYYFNYRFTPLLDADGNVYGVMNTAADVSDLNIAKNKIENVAEELTQTARRLQLALDAGKLGSYELDVQTGDIACTIQCKENFGYQATDILNYEKLVATILPEDRNNMQHAVQYAIDHNEIYDAEYRITWPDGSLHWIHAAGMPTYNEKGEPNRIIGVTVDITEQKLFSQELEKQVQDRTIELERKNNELEQMNTELKSFAYVSSHDLQEPLRKIQTFSSRILDKEFQNLSDNGKDYFNRMQAAARRMQALIEDLLSYSRTNNTERIFEKTDLRQLVAEVQEDIKDTLQAKNATVIMMDKCVVNIIPFQFRQLVQNLLTNAVKFSSPGRDPVITFKCAIVAGASLNNPKLTAAKYCHLTVSDNGIGFEPEYSEKIFELFQRLHYSGEYQGTGIGLSIVKKIVENHNGMITATGVLNEGATFDIYIPA